MKKILIVKLLLLLLLSGCTSNPLKNAELWIEGTENQPASIRISSVTGAPILEVTGGIITTNAEYSPVVLPDEKMLEITEEISDEAEPDANKSDS